MDNKIRQVLSNSTRKSIIGPKIISRSIDYEYEPSNKNDPKFIMIIENKMNFNYKVDYEDTNPNSIYNVFNAFNYYHSLKIKDIVDNSKNVSDIKTNNFNFAYHYFIDKKGNIYEGRPFELKAFNLDLYEYNVDWFNDPANKSYDTIVIDGVEEQKRHLPLLNQNDLLFNDCIIIECEEATHSIDTTNATYSALKSLIVYLKQTYSFKKFYGYNELMQIPFIQTDTSVEDIYYYNNPGLFFKINELHSSIDNTSIKGARLNTDNDIIIYSYGKRKLQYYNINPMSGNDVIMLQKMLYKLKLIKKYSYITGIYDKFTEEAVKAFQTKYYIKPESKYGIADINTLNTLRSLIYNEKMDNSKLIDDKYKPNRVLEYNEINPMTGFDIQLIQNKLKQIIYPILEPNGIFDGYTKDAVSMFQSKYAIFTDSNMIDGKIGPATWRAILECKDVLYINDGSDYDDMYVLYSITPTHCAVSKTNMIYLQKALNAMLKKYKVEIPLTGGYDELTQKYIRIINENENNRKIIGLDKYINRTNNEPLDWNDDYTLKTCYPAEFIWLIKHYLLNEEIELELVRQN